MVNPFSDMNLNDLSFQNNSPLAARGWAAAVYQLQNVTCMLPQSHAMLGPRCKSSVADQGEEPDPLLMARSKIPFIFKCWALLCL